jgi:signal transduction histidine kinase
LDDLGLEAAIEWHAKAFEKLTEIKCELKCGELSEDYSDEVKTAVFRIFQESTTNIIRHAKASEVKARLFEEENKIILEVKDNGVGISDERKKNVTSLGLLGMKERVGILDGTFLIRKLPTQGTLVRIEIPYIK